MNKPFAAGLVALLMLCLLGMESAAGDLVTPMLDSKEREARKAKLAQMAVAVSELSLGKSRLLLKSSQSADPGSGRPGRPDGLMGMPFLTVYPVSIPIATRLLVSTPNNGIVRQYGRILGAIDVLASTGGVEDKRKAPQDVYLLFVPVNGPLTVDMPLWLVSLKVDEDGKVTHSAAASTTVRITPSKLGEDDPSPVVTAGIDFQKAAVSMAWKEQSYTFSFEMDIWYL